MIKDVLKDGQFTDTVWYDLGLNLEISPNELDVIDKESNKDMSTCLRKMLTLWLQSGNARPQLLANALDEMGNKTAAAKVRKICKYTQDFIKVLPPFEKRHHSRGGALIYTYIR